MQWPGVARGSEIWYTNGETSFHLDSVHSDKREDWRYGHGYVLMGSRVAKSVKAIS